MSCRVPYLLHGCGFAQRKMLNVAWTWIWIYFVRYSGLLDYSCRLHLPIWYRSVLFVAGKWNIIKEEHARLVASSIFPHLTHLTKLFIHSIPQAPPTQPRNC